MPKHVNEMTRKEFAALPKRKWDIGEDLKEIDSIVIIPSRRTHDSGYKCIDYVAVSKDTMWMCGGGDVIHIDGIGGYGEWHGNIPDTIHIAGWNIDCLKKSGYLRMWCRGKITCRLDLSSMEILSVVKKETK